MNFCRKNFEKLCIILHRSAVQKIGMIPKAEPIYNILVVQKIFQTKLEGQHSDERHEKAKFCGRPNRGKWNYGIRTTGGLI